MPRRKSVIATPASSTPEPPLERIADSLESIAVSLSAINAGDLSLSAYVTLEAGGPTGHGLGIDLGDLGGTAHAFARIADALEKIGQ